MVKRITALIFALCLLVVFCGCETESPKNAAVGLSRWLDGEGLVTELWGEEFDEFIDKYKINGVPLSECVTTMFLDGMGGGQTSYYGEDYQYGYLISVWENYDTGYIDRTNEIYTAIPLENLVLPLEVEFGDTLSQVLSKLGADTEKISGVESSAETTLYSDSTYTLVAYNHLLSDESSMSAGDYEIVFTEETKSSLSDRRPVTVTRTVKLNFKDSDGDTALSFFQFAINENYLVE